MNYLSIIPAFAPAPVQKIYTFLFDPATMLTKMAYLFFLIHVYFFIYLLMYVYMFTKLARYETDRAFNPSRYGLYSCLSDSDETGSDEEDEDYDYDYETDSQEDDEPTPNPTRKPVFTLSNYSEKFADEYKKVEVKILTPDDLRRLSCNFVVEQTPLGNVFMCYHYNENDNALNAFHYYSDSTIPYGFLEVVAKKYVLSFDCKMLYVDIQNEMEKTKKRQEEQKAKICEDVKTAQLSPRPATKPNVFAKFKEYNRDTMSHSKELLQPKLSHQANAPVSSMNVKPTASCEKKDTAFVKEQINKYVFKGRVQNFGFLKKVDRKLVDKKYGLTFSDFKLLQLTKTLEE